MAKALRYRPRMLRAMDPCAIRVIQAEHQALAAMLRSVLMLIRQSGDSRRPLPFDVLRAMLFYIDEFPERLHHPKESGLLFPKLRARRPDLAPAIDALDEDHHRGEASVRELQHRLLAYELLGEPRRQAFETAAQRYVEQYLRHMTLEETTILPAARTSLTAEDWIELDAEFEANRDPLAGHDPSGEYAPLFKKIVHTAPAPVGLGDVD
jgi:hemerythrin-like domain-containing protein